jgi:hypothetical protein
MTVDVGTDDGSRTTFQVPSLVGLASHAPYMHTGCASSLSDVMLPSCGGTKHGGIGQMTAAQQSDLIAYLETL